jgi:hypothetical protein
VNNELERIVEFCVLAHSFATGTEEIMEDPQLSCVASIPRFELTMNIS